MKTSFNDNDSPEQGQDPGTQEVMDPKSDPMLPSTKREHSIDIGELKWSRLNVFNASSKYRIEGAVEGDIVLEKEIRVIPARQKCPLVVLARQKRFKEDIPYGSQEVPQTFETWESAQRYFNEQENPYPIIPYCDVAGLLKWDKETSPVSENDMAAAFPFEAGDDRYALVQYTVQKKRAVDENYARIRTIELANGGLWKKFVNVYSTSKSYAGNEWWQFMIAPTGVPVPDSTLTFIQQLMEL